MNHQKKNYPQRTVQQQNVPATPIAPRRKKPDRSPSAPELSPRPAGHRAKSADTAANPKTPRRPQNRSRSAAKFAERKRRRFLEAAAPRAEILRKPKQRERTEQSP
ncbi:hypothetical protein DQ04_02031150, partial [Trypanosoma grayi]|uniref:hypothetical protein n=1 Tax=Trypanosoma grayi TaxID=71804 RepID=UPI0004F44A0F